MLGTCKWFNAEKHFGFVSTEGGMDFFFHDAQVIGEMPKAGYEVSFWLDDDPRGEGRLKAVEVRRRGTD